VSVLTYNLHGKYLIKYNHLCIPERSLTEQIIGSIPAMVLLGGGGGGGYLGKDKTLARVTDHCSLVKYLQRYRLIGKMQSNMSIWKKDFTSH
jgi:hypothetical protein